VTISHRHLVVAPGTPPEELPLDALDDLLDRGTLEDWSALAGALRRDPHGALAERVLRLCAAHDMYGTSRLWPAFIARARARDERRQPPSSLAELRRHAGKTQGDVARALGISQSDVSKLERRDDVRLSTLRRYLAALGAELEVRVRLRGTRRAVALDLGYEPTLERRKAGVWKEKVRLADDFDATPAEVVETFEA
jgi:transcriptional regulator with XRE-family HTH domain